MRKAILALVLAVLFAGCVAHVTPEGTYIEPLPAAIVIGPPIIVAPPPHIQLRPLPPAVVVPDRHVYSYGGLYYYYWDGLWYYGERERGPWHKVPREYYPKKYKRYDDRDKYERERGRGYRD